jgi:hypothetical protein
VLVSESSIEQEQFAETTALVFLKQSHPVTRSLEDSKSIVAQPLTLLRPWIQLSLLRLVFDCLQVFSHKACAEQDASMPLAKSVYASHRVEQQKSTLFEASKAPEQFSRLQ